MADEPITITKVRPIDGDKAWRYEGAMLASPERRKGLIQILKNYPPTRKSLGTIVPAEGATLTGSDAERRRMGYELLLGFTWIADVSAGADSPQGSTGLRPR